MVCGVREGLLEEVRSWLKGRRQGRHLRQEEGPEEQEALAV